jgi:gluconolactonase
MKIHVLKAFFTLAWATLAALPSVVAGDAPAPPKQYPTIGKIERLDPELDAILAPDARIEKLAGGFDWAEGPAWDRKTGTLLFSDVPRNIVFQWREGVGTRDFLFPSGFTGPRPREGADREQGSNGLTFDAEGRLVLCQHGDRRIARLDPQGFTTLAQYTQHRRFNSPNDLVYAANGDLYFTDPTYGLPRDPANPEKFLDQELLFSGVYLLRRSGEVVVLTQELRFPNGVALSPLGKVLYVAVSDPEQPVIMSYPVRDDGTLEKGVVFFDAKPLMAGRKGVPDGLKVDRQGNVFATGPGGVLVLSPKGRLLGIINTGEATANCAFGNRDGSMLYLTADMYLCRIQTLTQGLGEWKKKKH